MQEKEAGIIDRTSSYIDDLYSTWCERPEMYAESPQAMEYIFDEIERLREFIISGAIVRPKRPCSAFVLFLEAEHPEVGTLGFTGRDPRLGPRSPDEEKKLFRQFADLWQQFLASKYRVRIADIEAQKRNGSEKGSGVGIEYMKEREPGLIARTSKYIDEQYSLWYEHPEMYAESPQAMEFILDQIERLREFIISGAREQPKHPCSAYVLFLEAEHPEVGTASFTHRGALNGMRSPEDQRKLFRQFADLWQQFLASKYRVRVAESDVQK